jgi:ribosomal protein S15P/S13E
VSENKSEMVRNNVESKRRRLLHYIIKTEDLVGKNVSQTC